MDIGQVAAAASGVTTFQVVPSSGQVNLVSGGGKRLTNGLSRVLVTINCKDGLGVPLCGQQKVIVVIGDVGLTTARALPLANYTVSMTSASLAGSVQGTNPISFTLNPIGANQSKSFYLGAQVPVAGDDSGRSTGVGYSPFYVSLLDSTGDLITYTLGSAVVTAYRALTVSKSSDLQFGTIGRPTGSTSGTVTIDPTTGARTATTGVTLYPTPAPSAAAFTISGEGGQTFSVSVPGTIQLTGKTNINIQTKTNLPASPVLSGSLGSAGSFTLRVGGTIPLANGSIPGSYSGTFAVTVNYN